MTTNDRPAIVNDRYELFKRIGRGGMADVFLGRDRLLDRQVAIKVLFPEYAVDPNFVERFRREAQAAANLNHPNIVSVFDWGRHAGTYFIAMEYVEGRTLAEILRTNGHVTSRQAAEIASEVASALGFAHQAGLVHRDIKPANILIGSNGQVKVADFGIARALNAPTELNLTQAGAVMGTATYFSPEQAQGAQPDPRSDLYSLGIVMYEMVAGRPPFSGENPVGIAYRQVHDHPQPLNQIVSDVPRSYEAIVAKLLAKDPRIRYPTAEALRDDLRRFRNGEPVQALAAAAGRNGATAPTVALAGAAATATTAAHLPGQASSTATSQPTVVQEQVATDGRPTGASPDARYYEPPPSRTGWYALAAFLALVALGLGGLLLFNALSGDDAAGSNALPNYAGQQLAVVIDDLAVRNLLPDPISQENTAVAFNEVFATEPIEGTVVVDGQVIKLFFRPEPQLKEVPNVENQPLLEAQRILGLEGFRIGPLLPEESEAIADGSVIRSDPPAGSRVEQATLINLVISSGRGEVAVPASVVGQPEDDATALLEADPYLFSVTSTAEDSDSIAEGLVIRTEPAAGQLVDIGSRIVLVVSAGAPGVEVPNVIGQPEADAVGQLSQFDVTVVDEELEPASPSDGLVLGQSVAAGQLAPAGTPIEITVGRAADPPPSTDPPATDPPATVLPPTAPPPTAPPPTAPPPTAAPTTAAPITAAPTTATPTTPAPPTTPAAPPSS
ncbi:MAG: Stk1 family PASTA domain-containing Ser/Thr kinase [Ilumatobacteraceae bacterium]